MPNVPNDQLVLKIESRTFSKICPGALFEWHQISRHLYIIRPGGLMREGILIAQEISLPKEAKQAVAAYVQGYAHGKEDFHAKDAERP